MLILCQGHRIRKDKKHSKVSLNEHIQILGAFVLLNVICILFYMLLQGGV